MRENAGVHDGGGFDFDDRIPGAERHGLLATFSQEGNGRITMLDSSQEKKPVACRKTSVAIGSLADQTLSRFDR